MKTKYNIGYLYMFFKYSFIISILKYSKYDYSKDNDNIKDFLWIV